MQLSITITGNQDVIRKVKKLGHELLDFTVEFESLGKTLADYYASAGFTDQGAPFGSAWPALAQSTLIYKEKHWSGKQALTRTGDMQRGFDFKAGPHELRIGNVKDYFKYHQSTAPRKTSPSTGKLLLPRRPMMGINNGIKRTVENEIQDGVRRKIDGVRL